MNPFKELQRVRDELLDKMEQVLQENVLVIAEIERKKFEATEKSVAFYGILVRRTTHRKRKTWKI